MEPEAVLLAQSAGITLVTLMTTDAWHRTREGIAQLWRRTQPDRAEAVLAELEVTREDAVAAGETGDQETIGELRLEWQGRLRRLLAAHPDAAVELRGLLDELEPRGSAGLSINAITQRADASGRARIYQAGRDQHIAGR
ncbi:hypothetical protein [Streptomyces graminilatus]|uniref:hypothetical protein n=1 Tax=Streptomyces graminilatus TaxID=1464070 RepID=UPI0006E22464|nr:hypothetical protein [Streptomyces graminilatus]